MDTKPEIIHPPTNYVSQRLSLEELLNNIGILLDSMVFGIENKQISGLPFINKNNFSHPTIEHWKTMLASAVDSLKSMAEKDIWIQKLIDDLNGKNEREGLINERDFDVFSKKLTDCCNTLDKAFKNSLHIQRIHAIDIDPNWNSWIRNMNKK